MCAGACVIALAVLGSVVAVCASGLVAWRWWLTARLELRAKQVQDLEEHLGRFADFERRLTSLEVNSKGLGRR